ncbi:MAG: hypothetical protein WBE55_11230 [Candidatus Sulfotelmatobacter sp.]
MKKKLKHSPEQRRKWMERNTRYLESHPEQVQKKLDRARARRNANKPASPFAEWKAGKDAAPKKKAAKLIDSAASAVSRSGRKVDTRV